jgi:hypothetical protein
MITNDNNRFNLLIQRPQSVSPPPDVMTPVSPFTPKKFTFNKSDLIADWRTVIPETLPMSRTTSDSYPLYQRVYSFRSYDSSSSIGEPVSGNSTSSSTNWRKLN